MNSKDIIKYLLYAGAAYLVYKYLTESGILAGFGIGLPEGTGIVPGTGTDAGTRIVPEAQTLPSRVVEPPAAAALPPATDAVLSIAAASAANAARMVTAYNMPKLNWHQWNWYRTAQDPTLKIVGPEAVGQGDGSALISVTQYHAAMIQSGMSGYRAQIPLSSGWGWQN